MNPSLRDQIEKELIGPMNVRQRELLALYVQGLSEQSTIHIQAEAQRHCDWCNGALRQAAAYAFVHGVEVIDEM